MWGGAFLPQLLAGSSLTNGLKVFISPVGLWGCGAVGRVQGRWVSMDDGVHGWESMGSGGGAGVGRGAWVKGLWVGSGGWRGPST